MLLQLLGRSKSRSLPVFLLSKAVLSTSSSSPTFGSRKEPTRFYNQVSVCESFASEKNKPKMFEINLDKKKLKTPSGQLFQVDNELLAHMIAHEWHSQSATIKRTTMHLTSLVNTCTDNPNKLTKMAIIASLAEYLLTDTVLFFDSSSDRLDSVQEARWRPIVLWFNTRFSTNLTVHKDLDSAVRVIGRLFLSTFF